MERELTAYLNEKFPHLKHEVCIRLELGGSLKSQSDSRLKQAYSRAKAITESIFTKEDTMYVLIKDWELIDQDSPEGASGYLYQLLEGQKLGSELIRVEDPGKHTGLPKHVYQQHIFKIKLDQIHYQRIHEGIANFEQGREPGIGQYVYFIHKDKDIIYYMYDDRGCVIYSDDTEKIRYLYDLYKDWIAEYWRPYMERQFSRN